MSSIGTFASFFCNAIVNPLLDLLCAPHKTFHWHQCSVDSSSNCLERLSSLPRNRLYCIIINRNGPD